MIYLYHLLGTMALNNPFNIRCNPANKWLGKVTPPLSSFEHFDTLEHGIRAGLILLANYRHNYGCDSVADFVSRFAPSSENPTKNYIRYVENYLFSNGYTHYNLSFYSTSLERELFFCFMAFAMIRFEGTYYALRTSFGEVRNAFRKYKVYSRLQHSN